MVLTLSSGNLVEVQQQQQQQQQKQEQLEETIVDKDDDDDDDEDDDLDDDDDSSCDNSDDEIIGGKQSLVTATTTATTVTTAVATTAAAAKLTPSKDVVSGGEDEDDDDEDDDDDADNVNNHEDLANGYYRERYQQYYQQQQQLNHDQHWLLKKDRIFLLVQFWQQRASLAEKEILSLKEQLNNNTLPKMNNNNNEDHDLKTSGSNSDHQRALDSQMLHKDNEISRLMQEVQRLQTSLTKVQETSMAQIACLEQQLDRCNHQIRRMEARLQLQSDYDEIRKELIRLLKLQKHSDNRVKYKDDDDDDDKHEQSPKTIENSTAAIPEVVIGSVDEKSSIDRLKTNNNGESDATNQMLDYYTNKNGDKCKNSDSDEEKDNDDVADDDDQTLDDQISKIANKVSIGGVGNRNGDEDEDDDDNDGLSSTDDSGYRKRNASALDTFGSFLGEEIVANWRKNIERSMIMAAAAAASATTTTTTGGTPGAVSSKSGCCRKKRRRGHAHKEHRKRIRLAGDDSGGVNDEGNVAEGELSDDDNESDGDNDDDDDADDDDDDDRMSLDDQDSRAAAAASSGASRVPAFFADSLVFGTPMDSKRSADDLSTGGLQQQQQSQQQHHHQYYQQQHAALCAAALFRNAAAAAAATGQKPAANPDESASSTIYHPHAAHHPMLDLTHFRSIAAAAAAAAAAVSATTTTTTAPATTTTATGAQSLGHYQQQQQQQPPPHHQPHHPYRFVDDLGSMVNRLGESLIPKGDPMEARLQEMLRFNMDKYASQNLDTLHISRKVRELLSIHNIGQRLFAKYVLGLSQGTVSELLSKPKPWDKLTEKGRDSYRKMHAWAYDDNAVMLLKSLIPKKGKEPSSVLPFVTNTPGTSTNTVNNTKSELATGVLSASTPKHTTEELPLATVASNPNCSSDVLDTSASGSGGGSGVIEQSKRVRKVDEDEQQQSQQQQQQPSAGDGNEAADDDNGGGSGGNDDNEDISRDKVMKIYQEELTKVLNRKYDEFRVLPTSVSGPRPVVSGPGPGTGSGPDHFSGLFYPPFLPIDPHHHQQHQQTLAHHLRTATGNPDDFRLILDTYNRELNKINAVPNLANLLAFQQQQPPHSTAALMLHQQQHQHRPQQQIATVPRHETVQDLSIKKEPATVSPTIMTSLSSSTSSSSSSSPSLRSPLPQSQQQPLVPVPITTSSSTLSNGFNVGTTSSASEPSVATATDKDSVSITPTPLLVNNNAILTPDDSIKTEQFIGTAVVNSFGAVGSTVSSSITTTTTTTTAATSSISNSIVSPLQRMASITNSLISQPTNQTHSNSAQRPLKAVLPPITQQQFDLYNNLNTEEIVKKVKENLSQYSISQRLFGESVLGLSQGSVSDLLARPKPWHMLTQKGREPFIRMKMFLEDENAVHKLVASQYKIAPEKLMRTGGTYTSASCAAAAAAAGSSNGSGGSSGGGVISQSNSTAVAAYAAAVAAAAAAASGIPKLASSSHHSSAATAAAVTAPTTAAAPSSKLLSPTITAASSAAAAAAAAAAFNSFEAYKKLTLADNNTSGGSGGGGGSSSAGGVSASTTTTGFGTAQSNATHTSPSVYEMAALTQDLDTQLITTKIKEALLANNIGQKIFGEAVLGLSQGSVSELLSKPKPWHMLSIKGREPFIRMQLWLNDAHNVDRLQALKNQRREATKRRRSFGCMSGSVSGSGSVAAAAGPTMASLWPVSSSSSQATAGALSLLNSSVAMMSAAQQSAAAAASISADNQLLDAVSTSSSIASTRSSPTSSILGDDTSDFYNVSSPGNSGLAVTTATSATISKKQRVLFTTEQKEALRLAFNLDAYPTTATIEFLASELGLSQRTITNWFHNHRMRLKQQNPHQWLDNHPHQQPQQQQHHHRSQFDPLTFRMLLNQRLLDTATTNATTAANTEPSGTTKLLPSYLQANPNIALLLSRSLFAAAAANAPNHYPPGGLLAAAAAASATGTGQTIGALHGLDLSVKQQRDGSLNGDDDDNDDDFDDDDDVDDGTDDVTTADNINTAKPTAIEMVKVTASRSRRKPIAPQWVNPDWQQQEQQPGGTDTKNIPENRPGSPTGNAVVTVTNDDLVDDNNTMADHDDDDNDDVDDDDDDDGHNK